jgi:hypothetical protein
MRIEFPKIVYLPHGIFYTDQNKEFCQEKCLTMNDEKYLAGSEYFYTNFCVKKINPKECINSFLIDRDYELENNKYNKLIEDISSSEYIIINYPEHLYDIEKLKTYNNGFNIPIVNLHFSSDLVFDMIKIIENAKELHLVSTFWALIIYYMQHKYNLFSKIPIFFHSYVRHGRLECLYKEYGTFDNWTFYNCCEKCSDEQHKISGI